MDGLWQRLCSLGCSWYAKSSCIIGITTSHLDKRLPQQPYCPTRDPCSAWWKVAACFPLHFPCLLGVSLAPVSLSGSPELLSVFISTLELSHFHFNSKSHLEDFWYISGVLQYVSNSSCESPDWFLDRDTHRPNLYLRLGMLCCKSPFSSFLHVLSVLYMLKTFSAVP